MSQKYILYANLQTIGRLNCFAETHAPREDGAPPFKQGDLTVLQKPVPSVKMTYLLLNRAIYLFRGSLRKYLRLLSSSPVFYPYLCARKSFPAGVQPNCQRLQDE